MERVYSANGSQLGMWTYNARIYRYDTCFDNFSYLFECKRSNNLPVLD